MGTYTWEAELLRSLVVILMTAVLVGGGFGAGAADVVNLPRVRDLVTGILQDVGSILESFAGGPDDPKSPINNPSTLRTDSARLNAASQKANELASELSSIRVPDGSGDRGN